MARNRLNQKATLSPLLSQGSQPRELVKCARRAAETGVNFERPLCVTTHGSNPQRLGSPGQPWGCRWFGAPASCGFDGGTALRGGISFAGNIQRQRNTGLPKRSPGLSDQAFHGG